MYYLDRDKVIIMKKNKKKLNFQIRQNIKGLN
jgi:hypothetical protein